MGGGVGGWDFSLVPLALYVTCMMDWKLMILAYGISNT